MNLGIIIAVSSYHNLDDLPGCARDARIIEEILTNGSRFDDVLALTESVNAAHTKAALSTFIAKHANTPVDDVVFYFSGHGDFDGNDFSFLLQNYDGKKRAQTSLGNSELDGMLRSLNPKLAVKIVDACHSGIQYVKEPDALQAHMKGSQAQFNNCYFLFSSQADQASLATDRVSFFTREIGLAVLNHASDRIRYKDVVDHVADAFQDSGTQVPLFVIQATYTEPLASVTPELRNALRQVLGDADIDEGEPTAVGETDLKDPLLSAVERASEAYSSREEATASLEAFGAGLRDGAWPEAATSLYDPSVTLKEHVLHFPDTKPIAEWLQKNGQGFFAELTYSETTVEEFEKRPRAPDLFDKISVLGGARYEYVKVERTKKVPRGIRLTAEAPFAAAEIALMPKFPALSRWNVYVVLCFSLSDFAVFYALVKPVRKNWDEYSLDTKASWLFKRAPLRDVSAMAACAQEILEDIASLVLEHTRKHFHASDSDGD